MAENPFSALSEGIAQGAQMASNAQSQAQSWATNQAKLDLEKEQAAIQKERFDMDKKEFDFKIGNQYLSAMKNISYMPKGPAKSAALKRLAGQAEQSGYPVDPVLLASLDDPNYVAPWDKLWKEMTGLETKMPKEYVDVVSNVASEMGMPGALDAMQKLTSNISELTRARIAADAKKKEAAAKPSTFQEAAKKEQGKQYAEELAGMAGKDQLIEKIDRTIGALETYVAQSPGGTGPIATAYGLTAYVSRPTEKLNAMFNDLSVQKMSELFQGMSRAIDTGAERRAYDSTQASISKDEKTNAEILLGARSLAMKQAGDIKAKQAFVEQKGDADGFVPPSMSQTTLIDAKGQMRLVPKDQKEALLKDGGFKTLDGYVDERFKEIKKTGGKVKKAESKPASSIKVKENTSRTMQMLKDKSPEERARILKRLHEEFPDPATRKRLGIP